MKPQARHKAYQKRARTVLRLPDLEFAKAAVLDSLTSTDAQLRMRSYGCAAWVGQLSVIWVPSADAAWAASAAADAA